jgi:hypothetical protein
MNETQIRERLRGAVGEARYPVNLSSRIEARLKDPLGEARRSSSGIRAPWLLGFGRVGTVAAMLLVVLLVAALAIGMHAWRTGDLNAPLAPAGTDPAVRHYQAMTVEDDQLLADAAPAVDTCNNYGDPKCLPATAIQTRALQQWLDDLNATRPPARFAAVDTLIRRHLGRLISVNKAWAVAYQARNDTAVTGGNNAYGAESDALETLAADVVESSPRTTDSYLSAVQLNRADLLACIMCQQLVNQDSASCEAQAAACADEIATIRLQLESSIGDLVWGFAPSRFAIPDARLQADLLAADQAVYAMESALNAGDQAGLQAAQDLLRQALGRVDADSAGIVRAN